MQVLIVGNFHHKNQEGYNRIFEYLKYRVTYDVNDIEQCDIVVSPIHPIDSSKYPDKRFVFGPNFSVFPDVRLYHIKNLRRNSIYIQPSEWPIRFWENYGYYTDFQKSEFNLPIKPFFLPVNTEKFCPSDKSKTKVFIYYKRRKFQELLSLITFLKQKGIEYVIFDYVKRYKEDDYLAYLQESKYGIVLDAHESQGFAIQEALSCNVPLLVWNVRFMSQEINLEGTSNYEDFPVTTIPYWDDRCGEFFHEKDELDATFQKFVSSLDKYKPREFVLEKLSLEKSAENFVGLLGELEASRAFSRASDVFYQQKE